MKGIADQAGTQVTQTAQMVVREALSRIETGIAEMFEAWQREPVYRIWELKQKGARRPDTIAGVGAAAASLVPSLAKQMGARAWIPAYAAVANALGAAVARTTLTTTLHFDTERDQFEIVEEGISERLTDKPGLAPGGCSMADAQHLAREWMVRRGKALGVPDPLADCEVVLAEQFNVIDGWRTTGRIFDVCLERRCGLVDEWKGQAASGTGESQ